MAILLECAPRRALPLYADEHRAPLFDVAADRRIAALIIDDRPHPITIPATLEVLARHGAPATFCLISEDVPGNEALVRRLPADGQAVQIAVRRRWQRPGRLRPPRLPSGADSSGAHPPMLVQAATTEPERHFYVTGTKFRRGGVMGTIALVATAVALALWFKRIGERHDRAFAEQQARLGPTPEARPLNQGHLRFTGACTHVAAMDLQFWTKALEEAECELEAATTRTATNAAAKRLMLAKRELERAATATKAAGGA